VVITLSRQAQSGGDKIAELVAGEAGMRLADRGLLEQMAQRAGLPLAHMEMFDEMAPGPIEALLAEWQTSVSQVVYLRRLVHTLLVLEREDNVIIIGRGAAFVLTNPGTLHVRVVAPMPCRIARLMEGQDVTRVTAERTLRKNDEERARFIRQAFGAEIDNPVHYDLVVNTAELPLEQAAEVILCAAQRKRAQRQTVPVSPEDLMARVPRLRRRPHEPRVSEGVWEYCQRRPRPAPRNR
jgi:cytidylate kinase